MDDRIEHSGDSAATTSNAIGRREMLQRTGFVVGAAALWTTPMVKSISASAAVATGDFGRDSCEDVSGNNSFTSLTFTFIPANGYSMPNTAPPPGQFVTRIDVPTPWPDGPFTLSVTPKGAGAGPTVTKEVYSGDTITVLGTSINDVDFTVSIGEVVYQDMSFHTSCSDPLQCGGNYGSLRITAGTWSKDGGGDFAC